MVPDDFLTVGSVIAGHRLESVIGQGGMGIVYRATHLELEREVALKVISPALAGDQSFRHRFKRESRTAASLRHPHIVTIFDAGEDRGHLYITMEYVRGTDLREVLAETGPLEPGDAIDLASQIASALDAAHEEGLVHRDVKPANILIQRHGGRRHAYLTDFGLTRHVTSVGGITRTGQWVGTLDYVAPEQIQGQHVDGQADAYSLTCVLFESLTGRLPFDRDTDMAKMWAQVHEDPPSPADVSDSVSPALGSVVLKGLAKDPEQRYGSAGEMTAAAAEVVSGGSSDRKSPPRRRRGRGHKEDPPKKTGSVPEASAATPTAGGGRGGRTWDAIPTEPMEPAAAGRRRIALVAVAGVLAAAVGFAVSGGFSSDASADETPAKNGSLSLSYGSDWIRDVTGGAPLDGFKVRNAIALGYAPLSGAGILRAGRLLEPAPGEDPLPTALRKRLGGEVKQQTVEVGGVKALSYTGETAPSKGSRERVDALVIPTTAGYQGVACEAPSGRSGFFRQCEQVMSTVRLVEADALPIGADPELAELLGNTYAALRTAEKKNEDDLSADSTETQSEAAAAIAGSYKAPLRKLRAYDPAPRDAEEVAGLISAMADLGSAYDDLATAAAAEDSDAYDEARDAVSSASKKFDRAVDALEANGYPIRAGEKGGGG